MPNPYEGLPSYHDPASPRPAAKWLAPVAIGALVVLLISFGIGAVLKVPPLPMVANDAEEPAGAPAARSPDTGLIAFRKRAAAQCVANDVREKVTRGSSLLLPPDRLVGLIANDCGAAEPDNLLIRAGLSGPQAAWGFRYLAAQALNRAEDGDPNKGRYDPGEPPEDGAPTE